MGHSPETRAKIARGNTGKVFTPERCKNIARALEFPITPELLRKLEPLWEKGYYGPEYIRTAVGLSQRVYNRVVKTHCKHVQVMFLDRSVPPEIYEKIIQDCLSGVPYKEIQVGKEPRWIRHAIVSLGKRYQIKPLPKPRPKRSLEHQVKLHNAIVARNKRCPLRREKNPRWRGGISKLTELVRKMPEYAEWRTAVFKRDDWRCTLCSTGGYLEADHLKPFSLILVEEDVQSVEEARNTVALWNIENGRTLCQGCHRQTETFGIKTRRKVEHARAKQQ